MPGGLLFAETLPGSIFSARYPVSPRKRETASRNAHMKGMLDERTFAVRYALRVRNLKQLDISIRMMRPIQYLRKNTKSGLHSCKSLPHVLIPLTCRATRGRHSTSENVALSPAISLNLNFFFVPPPASLLALSTSFSACTFLSRRSVGLSSPPVVETANLR